MFKEHLIGLNLDKTVTEAFQKIEPGVKANFTRQYNKMHQAITKKVTGKGKSNAKNDDSSNDEDSDNDGGDVLLDEEEM